MTLQMMKLSQLKDCPMNMRKSGKKPDVSDLLPSVRQYGVVQSLLVRPNCDGFEVIAGRRRYHAALQTEQEEVPVLVKDMTDAEALEASAVENLHRLDPSPIEQFETFSKLVTQGKTAEEISEMFLVPLTKVQQRLAIGNLIKPLRDLIRADELYDNEISSLALVSKAKQKEYMQLRKDGNQPMHFRIRAWCLGNTEIPTRYALFDLEAYKAGRINDLFKEAEFFTDSAEFWKLQNEAIAARMATYEGNGWEVVLLDKGKSWASWEHSECTKKDGGRVYIEVDTDGEVKFHEGYITRKEKNARERQAEGQGADNGTDTAADRSDEPTRGEITFSMVQYFDLHRAAAVREDLADKPKIALRYAVALLICGNNNVSARYDGARYVAKSLGKDSIENAPATIAFDKRTADILKKFGIDVTGRRSGWEPAVAVFEQLQTMKDADVLKVLAAVTASHLETGTGAIDHFGELLGTDLSTQWEADEAFYDGIRDKVVIRKMLTEVAGSKVAASYTTATGKVMKGVIKDYLTGANGRDKVTGWVPPYLQFPAKPYVNPFKIESLNAAAKLRKSLGQQKKASRK